METEAWRLAWKIWALVCSGAPGTVTLGVPEDKDCDDGGGKEEQIEAEKENVHYVAKPHPKVHKLGICQLGSLI